MRERRALWCDNMSATSLFTHPKAAILALVLLTAAFAPRAALTEIESTDSHLSTINGVVMLGGHALNGHILEHHDNGGLKRDAEYRNGKLNGVARGWHENGRLDYVRRYVAGTEQGTHEGWYDNGSRRFEFHFNDGVSEGEAKQWYRNGKPYTLFHFVAGQESGQQQMWDADGNLRANYVIRDGRRYGLPGSVGCRGAL